jgi:hypothetical protein
MDNSKIKRDSAPHFVPLRMTDTWDIEEGGGWRHCLQPPPSTLQLTKYLSFRAKRRISQFFPATDKKLPVSNNYLLVMLM